MADYSNACIYKIACKDTNVKEIYVGSTVNFKSRVNEHRYTCNTKNRKGFNIKVYQYIRDNGGWENWEMTKIADVKPCLDRYILRKAEGEYQKKLKPTLNTQLAGRTWIDRFPEYYKKNNDRIKAYDKEYRQKNKEDIKKKRLERHAKKKTLNIV